MPQVKGKCLCGAVRYAAEIAEPKVEACHCTMCRSWASGAYLSVAYDGDVEFSGNGNIGVYRASQWGERAFCKVCGSSLYWRLQGSDHYAFSAGTIEDQSMLDFTKQIFIDEKPPYYDFANETARLTGKQVADEFAAKMKS
jgi:hypothetical protein